MSNVIPLAQLKSLVGDSFTITSAPEGTPALKLIEVKDLPPHELRSDPYCLTFEVTEPHHLMGQGCYEVHHAQQGNHETFLVPVGTNEGRLRLEGVHN